MLKRRPHRVSVNLTTESYQLAKRRFVAEHGNFQRVLNAAISAYIMGELRVHPDGTYAVVPDGDDALVWEADDPEAADVLDLDSQMAANGLEEMSKPSVLGIRDLCEYVEEHTGRRATPSMLRFLLKELAPDYRDHPKQQWRIPIEDPLLGEVIEAVAAGRLTEIRNRRLKRAGIKPDRMADFE